MSSGTAAHARPGPAPLQAIFWDNDGVLVDTERLYFAASRAALAEEGIALSAADFAAISLDRGASVFLLAERAGVGAARIAELRELRNRVYAHLLAVSGDLVLPGVREALAALRPRVAVMGIVSNSLPEHFAIIHKKSGLRQFFDFHLVAGDCEKAKPDPAPYLAALARAGVAADEAVAVEDGGRGLRSALAAGLRCLVVAQDLGRAGDFAGADLVCASMSEAAAWLARATAPPR